MRTRTILARAAVSTSAAALVVLLLLGGAQPAAAAGIEPVEGQFVTTVTPDGCTSPLGLCTVGTIEGGLEGAVRVTFLTTAPASQAPPWLRLLLSDAVIAEDTVYYTADIVIDSPAGSFRGDIQGLVTFSAGSLESLVTLDDGDGVYRNARAALLASGTPSVSGPETLRYEGVLIGRR